MINRNDPCWCGSGKKYKKCHLVSDMNGDASGTRRPRSVYVKSAGDIEGMRRAGAFNGLLLAYIRPLIRPGMTTDAIDTLVREYTEKHGHRPATLGYHGFPKSCCVSVNNVVCHGIPSAADVLKDGDIVNVDLTTLVEGYYGDSSETFMLGRISDEARHLVRTSALALLKGIAAVGPGRPLYAVAEAIEPYVRSQGCSVVRQYTGHGIGIRFHEHFTVYHHVDKKAEPVIMEPGMTFTIEPMINLGDYKVITDSRDRWTVRTRDGSLSAQFEHTVLVTETGVEILTLTPSQKAAGKPLLLDGISLD